MFRFASRQFWVIAIYVVLGAQCNPPAEVQCLFVNVASTAPSPDGSSWASAFPTIRQALDAEVWAKRKAIYIANGTYTTQTESKGLPTPYASFEPVINTERSGSTTRGVDFIGGFLGTEKCGDVPKPENAAATILDGKNQSYHTILIADRRDFSLSTMTVTGGNAREKSNVDDSGGGLFVQNSELRIRNVTFSRNKAEANGGGIWAVRAQVVMEGIRFYANEAMSGGGLSTAAPLSLEITNSVFDSNKASGDGGGLLVARGELKLVGTTFENNTASIDGGAMWVSLQADFTESGTRYVGNKPNDLVRR